MSHSCVQVVAGAQQWLGRTRRAGFEGIRLELGGGTELECHLEAGVLVEVMQQTALGRAGLESGVGGRNGLCRHKNCLYPDLEAAGGGGERMVVLRFRGKLAIALALAACTSTFPAGAWLAKRLASRLSWCQEILEQMGVLIQQLEQVHHGWQRDSLASLVARECVVPAAG